MFGKGISLYIEGGSGKNEMNLAYNCHSNENTALLMCKTA